MLDIMYRMVKNVNYVLNGTKLINKGNYHEHSKK